MIDASQGAIQLPTGRCLGGACFCSIMRLDGVVPFLVLWRGARTPPDMVARTHPMPGVLPAIGETLACCAKNAMDW